MAEKKSNRTGKKQEVDVMATQGTQKGKKKKSKGEKPQKNMKARLMVWGIVVVLLVSLVIVVLNAPILQGDKLDRSWRTPRELQGKTKTILICGVDNDDNRENEAWMTDVIMLLNMDMERNEATILQIPRDTYVGQDLVEYGKINGLYYFGYKEQEGSGGIRCLAETINNQFQLYVDNYVVITMEGFRQVVDLLGGIEVTLDHDVEFENFSLPAGTHVLSGVQADEFVRFRKGYENADLDRMEMQRVFLQALMVRLLNTSKIDLASMVMSVYSHLDTDLSINEVLELANEAKELSLEAIRVIRVPGEPVTRYGMYGVDIFTVHTEKLADILNEYMRPYSDDVPATDLNVIQVQNTTDEYDDPGGTLGSASAPG